MKKMVHVAHIICILAVIMSVINISTSAATTIEVSSVSELQSTHPYSSSMDTTWVYTHPTSAEGLRITFSSDTFVENNYDYIYIYDGSGTEIGKYTGSALSSQTIEVTGNVVKIRLTSDSSTTKQGFTVTSIEVGDGVSPEDEYSGTCGNSLTWSFNPDTGEIIISGTGSMTYFSSASAVPWSEYCSDIKTVTIDEEVTSIGRYAFDSCTNLTQINWNAKSVSDFALNNCIFYNAGQSGDGINVVFGDSVKKIPAYAFYSYSGASGVEPKITSVTIGKSVTSIGQYAFYDCSDLASITGGDAVTSIGQYAFYNCSSLASIEIPEGVTSIGIYAFYNCTNLIQINWNAKEVADFATQTNYVFYCAGRSGSGISVVFGDGVEKIPTYAFCPSSTAYDAPKITSVTIGKSVASIGRYAFYNSDDLTQINWNAKSVEDFASGNNVFYKAGQSGNGIDVVFGDSVENVPVYAFYPTSSSSYAPKIISVTIGSSVTSIGKYTFYNCSTIENVYYGGLLEGWCSISFGDVYANPMYYAENLYINGELLAGDVVIPESVKSIKKYAFYNCSAIENVYYGGTLGGWIGISFGDGTANPMCNTENLYINGELLTGDIIIPEGVTSIGSYSLHRVSGLTSVTIPKSVTSIGYCAFGPASSTASPEPIDVYYDGTEEDWAKIEIGTLNENITSGTIHYIAPVTEIEIEGVVESFTSLAKAFEFANESGNAVTITIVANIEQAEVEAEYEHILELDSFVITSLDVKGRAIIKNGTVATLNVTGLVETENVTVISTDAVTYGTDGTKGVYTSYDDGVTCVDGAQVRIGGGVSAEGMLGNGDGIRFIGQADFNDTLTSVIMGEHYADAAFDEGFGIGMEISAEESDSVIYIPVKSWQDEANGVFTVALTNLAENNYNRRFTARVYVEYNGIKIFGEESTTRSIYAVAAGLLKQSTAEDEQRLIDVLNAYVNHTGIRLVFKDSTLNVNDGSWGVNGGYTGEAFFSVGDTLKIGNTYYVGLTPVGVKTKLDVGNFTKYIRINNNNSQISGAVTLVDNNDGTYTLTFNINNIG